MRRRSKRNGNYNSQLDYIPAELGRRPVYGRVLTVTTYLPRPVAKLVRREIYPYPYPKQIQKRGRTIRLALSKPRGKMVKAKVRIRLPKILPLVKGSYVSLARNRLNIHSWNQTRGLIDAQEFNRRRYTEYKRNHRKAAHGQLDSRGSQRFGATAHAYRRGATIDQIAEAALAVRAISQRR